MINETWKSIDGYAGLYEVSDAGRVRSFVISTRTGNLPGPHIMRLRTRARDGYQTVNLGLGSARKTHKVHQLVAAAFVARPDGEAYPDHVNGQRADNRAENLRWVSRKFNSWNRHSIRSASGAMGVYKSKSPTKPWRAAIMRHGRNVTIGYFATISDASAAREAVRAAMEAA